MLFNSIVYIFMFFPLVALVYFAINRRGFPRVASGWLVVASMYFYGYWNPVYLPLITLSVISNFIFGKLLQLQASRLLLAVAISLNLGVLAYFKYAGFIVENVDVLLGHSVEDMLLSRFGEIANVRSIKLPLAISFFTFLQIAYLVDCFQGKVRKNDFLHYSLFVTYFPHLIAGPLVHHQSLMPEFDKAENKIVNWEKIYLGLFIFSMGLFKKVYIADTFSHWASMGFDSVSAISFFDAWGSSLSYTMQLYYDFSGYSDMAIGASLILNIALPDNFNSPYKALDIQDFWRRWHITLSQWLRDYLYIPLGGNRHGSFFTGINLLITFFLGGLWHGASWNFVIWGALHGVAVVSHRIWHACGLKLPQIFAWIVTFMFVNVAWVFFRAKTLGDSLRILHGMTDIDSAAFSQPFAAAVNYFMQDSVFTAKEGVEHMLPVSALFFLAVFLPVSLFAKNSRQLANMAALQPPTWRACCCIAVLIGVPIFQMLFMSSNESTFIYFNF